MSSEEQEPPAKPEDKNFRLMKDYFKGSYRQAIKDVGFSILWSFGKYGACYWCLKDREESCEVNPLSVWLTVVGVYEFLNTIR